MAILAYTREVDSTNRGIADASPGDYITMSNGTKYVLNQGDIDYARKQLGLSTTINRQIRTNNTTNASSPIMNFISNFIIMFLVGIIIVIFVEWQIGKAIGKSLSKETGTVLGVILIFLGISIFIGIPIIIYSRGAKQYKIV